MAERMLVTKVKRLDATTADLYARGHRYADLKLFDLALLGAAGVDYESLPIGQETPALFWASWEFSERVNKAGNRYRDIVSIEATDAPATSTSVDNSALLGELRAIRALLQVLIEGQGLQVPEVVQPGQDQDDGDPGEESELDLWFPRIDGGGQVPTSPGALLEALRSQCGNYFSNVPGLFEACRAELGDGWRWPTARDVDGWRATARAALSFVKKNS